MRKPTTSIRLWLAAVSVAAAIGVSVAPQPAFAEDCFVYIEYQSTFARTSDVDNACSGRVGVQAKVRRPDGTTYWTHWTYSRVGNNVATYYAPTGYTVIGASGCGNC